MINETPVVLAVGLGNKLRDAARDWAVLHGGQVRLAQTGREALRYVATNQHSHWLVMVDEIVADMPTATVICSARDLLGPTADIVAVASRMSPRRVSRLERAGANWCVAEARQVLHPSAPVFHEHTQMPAA